MRRTKKKIWSISRFKKAADKVASEYFRKRDMNICYTCGKVMSFGESQCGHFVPRDCLELRYDEKNNHCQCVVCNVFKKGNMIIYTLNMIRDYGIKLVKEYNAIKDRKGNYKLYREDYQRIIDEFKQKIKDLHYDE